MRLRCEKLCFSLLSNRALAAFGIVTRPEFARNIQPGFSRQSEAGGCCAAAGMQSHLRDDTRGSMS